MLVDTSSRTVADLATTYLLRYPLVFLAAVLFAASFGAYMVAATAAWPRDPFERAKARGRLPSIIEKGEMRVNGDFF